MWKFEVMWTDPLGLFQQIDIESPQVLADRRDELHVVEPHQMRARFQRVIGHLETKCRDTVGLVERGRVVEDQMLSGVPKEARRVLRADRDGMPPGDAGEVGNLVGIGVVGGVVAKDAHPRATSSPFSPLPSSATWKE
jgi:hypothetical protein